MTSRPLLVFPLSNDSHWISIVIDASRVTYEVLDTGMDRYRRYNPFPWARQNEIAYTLSRTVLQTDISRKPRENISRDKVPQQNDDHICGPAQISLWRDLAQDPHRTTWSFREYQSRTLRTDLTNIIYSKLTPAQHTPNLQSGIQIPTSY